MKRLQMAQAADYAYRGMRLIQGFMLGRPIHCIVQISNRCNLTCGFCSFWERPLRREDEMTVADIEVISAKLAEAGSMIISIEGGEPLLRNDIVEIVRAFSRYHHPILFTNGACVTESLARNLWDAGLSEIGVSIDYADPARHDEHRGQAGTFDIALSAVDLFRQTAPHGGRQVTLMTVVMDDNTDEMDALLQLSASKGVSHQVTLLSVDGGGRSSRAGKKRPQAGTGAKLLALKQRYPHFITFSGYLEGIDPFLMGNAPRSCSAGIRFLNIDHRGEVSPCIEKLHASVGNLRRDPWPIVFDRLSALAETKQCADCHTSCKGFVEEMSGMPKTRSYKEFFGNFASASTVKPAPKLAAKS